MFEILGRGGDIEWAENECEFYTPPKSCKIAEYKSADRTWRIQNPYVLSPQGRPCTIYQRILIKRR